MTRFTRTRCPLQGILVVTADLNSAIAPIQDQTATARADSVGQITTYETKYRPMADKYNSWCAPFPEHGIAKCFIASFAPCGHWQSAHCAPTVR